MSENRQLFKRNFKATITNLASGKSVTITDLRIAFKLTKTKKSKGNRAAIQIYNMSPANRGLTLALNTKSGNPQTRVALFGGYGEESKLLFNGIGLAATEWDAPDWISKFVLTDSLSLTTRPFEVGYRRGTPIDSIIGDLLKAIGLPTGVIQKLGTSLP